MKKPTFSVHLNASVETAASSYQNVCSLNGVRLDRRYAVLRRISETQQVILLSRSLPSTAAHDLSWVGTSRCIIVQLSLSAKRPRCLIIIHCCSSSRPEHQRSERHDISGNVNGSHDTASRCNFAWFQCFQLIFHFNHVIQLVTAKTLLTQMLTK